MNTLLAQTQSVFSHDTSLLVVVAVAAVLCGAMASVLRRRVLGAIVSGVLALLLAAFIVLAKRYDPEFVMLACALLVLCAASCVVWATWQLGRATRPRPSNSE